MAQHRTVGRRVLLNAIRRSGPVARIDLAQDTGISRATVTTITAQFLKDGLIEEIPRPANEEGDAATARGRPRVDLKLRGAAHIVAGIKISNRSFTLVLLDFEGSLIEDHEMALDNTVFSPVKLIEHLKTGLADLTAKAGITTADLSAVGIGIAGTVDAPRGFVYWSPSLSERNIHFADQIRDALKMPVFLDNDANLVALAEQSFGYGQDKSDFIVITIESGVGMGIVLNGELYRGTRGCGAEFGHTKVHLDGALCRCGQRGCLEAYVADYALLREASVGGGDVKPAITDLLNAARDGDTVASNIVNRAGRMFAMGLANLVNIFDPQLIILAGERMQSDHLYAEEVIESMRQSIVQIDKAPPEIMIHKWGDLMWAKGAAAYALNGVIEHALGDSVDHAA